VEADLSADDGFVDLWGDDVLVEEDLDEEDILVGDIGDVEVLSVDLTENGEEVDVSTDDGLEDFRGDDVLLEENVQEEDIIDVLFDNGVDGLDWDDLLLNLDINNLGFFNDELALTSDWLNNNLLISDQSLNISLDLSDIPDDWLVVEQSLVDLVQKELVVGLSGGVWQVLTSEAGGGETITVVVNVWKDIHVPLVKIISVKSLESEDILG